MHTIRKTISKILPIPKKGTKYVIVSSHNKKFGVPVLIIMRDILGFVKTRKELKKIMLEKKVLVNNKFIREENRALLLFDTLKLKDLNKSYRLSFNEHGRAIMKEIADKECEVKICRIINKKILKGKKVQLNFNDGTNVLSNEKVNVGDCVLINLNKWKIEKVMPIKEKSSVLIIKGKYIGKEGEILNINGNEVEIKSGHAHIKTKLNEVIINE